jgi:hypothetical protein
VFPGVGLSLNSRKSQQLRNKKRPAPQNPIWLCLTGKNPPHPRPAYNQTFLAFTSRIDK